MKVSSCVAARKTDIPYVVCHQGRPSGVRFQIQEEASHKGAVYARKEHRCALHCARRYFWAKDARALRRYETGETWRKCRTSLFQILKAAMSLPQHGATADISVQFFT